MFRSKVGSKVDFLPLRLLTKFAPSLIKLSQEVLFKNGIKRGSTRV